MRKILLFVKDLSLFREVKELTSGERGDLDDG